MGEIPAEFVFHLPGSWLGRGGSGLLPFYQKLTEGLKERGFKVDHVPLDRDLVLAHVASDAAFHVVNHGRFQHPRILNAGIAYIYPFWNMDPQGIRAFSSIAHKPFDARDIDPDIARPFFRRLRKRLVGGRTSRYPQPDGPSAIKEGCIAVFLQSEAHRGVGETCYMDRWDMIETCVRSGQPVVVKPHPRDNDETSQKRLLGLAQTHSNLTISTGNIHDILAASSRVVTLNSAVGIEAYLHKRPVVLCGQADFHHIADQAKTADRLSQILNAPIRSRAYAKYIHWYFAQNCLSTTEPDLIGRFLARVTSSV